jgi:hypothetical protein
LNYKFDELSDNSFNTPKSSNQRRDSISCKDFSESKFFNESNQIDTQHLFSKISIKSRSMESLLISDDSSVESDYDFKKNKMTKKSRFAETKNKENEVMDVYDRSFALRTELIYKNFNSNKLDEKELDDDSRLFMEKDLNKQNEIVESSIQRKEIEEKIQAFNSKKHEPLSKSFLTQQAQMYIDFQKNGSDDDLLNYELIVHGYVKGIYQRVRVRLICLIKSSFTMTGKKVKFQLWQNCMNLKIGEYPN